MAFKKPEQVVQGTKILIYGEESTLKSRTALTFPRIVYIDADQGADSYYGEFSNNLIQISDSTTYSEVINDLDELENMLDDFDTIVLDSDTKIYENQQHTAMKVAEQRARKNKRLVEGEGLSTKEWGIIKLNHEKMYSKLFENKKEGKTIIVIAESKDEKEAVETNNGLQYKTVGITPNSAKGVKFDFDIVLEMIKNKDGTFGGSKVIKDRLGVVPQGDIILEPSYEVWAEAIEKKRNRKVKSQRRDFEKDIENDMDSFDPNSNKEATKITKKIDDVMKKLTNTQKKTLIPKFKELFDGDPVGYKTSDDTDALGKAIEIVNELVAS